jgi:hypothetical protein
LNPHVGAEEDAQAALSAMQVKIHRSKTPDRTAMTETTDADATCAIVATSSNIPVTTYTKSGMKKKGPKVKLSAKEKKERAVRISRSNIMC